MSDLVTASDFATGYDGSPAISEVSFNLTVGRRLALLGPNGGGKTTLLRAMLGELRTLSGRLEVRVACGTVPQTERSRLPGQQVSLTGLVMKSNRSPSEPFQLGRFYITCCIADAIPISVSIYPTLAKGRFIKDDWLEVDGALAKRDGRLVVDAESITQVDEPSNPYLAFR